MENRILIIGDELLGEQGEAANRFAEILLCREANRPIQFSINAPAPQSMHQLLDRAAADVIGKKAGRIIVGLGLKELKRGGADYRGIATLYEAFVNEILSKTFAPLHLLTIPEDMFPVAPSQLTALNECVRNFEAKDPNRVKVMDFSAYAAVFKEKQLERGKFGRSLYSENGMPTAICNTFLALYLYDCIMKEIK
ncbi:hypothetical protein [uncultured Fibrobacter sp.]|uniref:hypothetical protein n=1 Tax=uncultured Fibrobacter sp. TaxID=261512 RepID=UPI00260661BC|nr:hypothetical protein [uncultured Fibrobacter sp.]